MPEDTCPLTHHTRDGWTTCARPLQGGTICPTCTSDHAARLNTIPGLLEHLHDLTARITTTGGAHGGHSVPGPRSPARDDLIDLEKALRAALNAWADQLAPEHPRTTPEAATWLSDAIHAIRTRPWAPDMIRNLDHHIDHLTDTVEPPPARIRITCPTCGHRVPLNPDPHDTTHCRGRITNPDGTHTPCPEWGVQSWWIDRAGTADKPTHIRGLHDALLAHGFDIPTDTIRTWADRGHIPIHSHDNRGRRLYDPAHVAAHAATLAARRRTTRTA